MTMVSEKQLCYLDFLNRENKIRHHRYDEEMIQYDYLKMGNPKAVEESVKMWKTHLQGCTADDPLTNMRYLFVASITLATRFAIEGGMEEERAYLSSDLYIRKMDSCKTIEEILNVHKDMFSFFTDQVAKVKRYAVKSKPVVQCIDYISYHLHEKMTTRLLAAYVGLNANYLSVLFKQEIGSSVSDYIAKQRIDVACNMLRYSDYSYVTIAASLAFSSQSHFIHMFHKKTGVTPAEYRKKYYKVERWSHV